MPFRETLIENVKWRSKVFIVDIQKAKQADKLVLQATCLRHPMAGRPRRIGTYARGKPEACPAGPDNYPKKTG